jgi:gas vesicle protein
MATKRNGGKFLLAGLLGAAAGAIGGLLFAPKSGKETREDIKKMATDINNKIKTGVNETKTRAKEVFGEANDAAVAKYNEIKTTVSQKVATLKTAGEEIDKTKYSSIVDDVVSEFRDDLTASKDAAKKLSVQLKKDWEKVKKALA